MWKWEGAQQIGKCNVQRSVYICRMTDNDVKYGCTKHVYVTQMKSPKRRHIVYITVKVKSDKVSHAAAYPRHNCDSLLQGRMNAVLTSESCKDMSEGIPSKESK